jgi:16S rRNA (guanine1516-N2)-methyltransferase
MTGTPAPLAVTLSGRAEATVEAEARAAAASLGVPFLPRPRKGPLHALLGTHAGALLVFSRDAVTLVDSGGQLSFHAGMAHLRMQRLASGEGDTLVRLAGLAPGEAVLDCTLGLGQDALVAARAVGPSGRVVGLEKSLPLFAVLSAGLRRTGAFPDACAVEVHHADADAFLRAQPAGAFDVVLFDPMFDAPKKSQPAFELLRRHAEHAPLAPETLAEARRVARRRVVVKAGRYTPGLQRLGLVPRATSRYADVVWGVLEGGTVD